MLQNLVFSNFISLVDTKPYFLFLEIIIACFCQKSFTLEPSYLNCYQFV